MRKQGEAYLKLISILLAGVIAAYVLFSVILNSGSGYALETVVYCEVGDGVTVSGFVVRSEEALLSTAPLIVRELREGERVGSGQTVATGYQTADARKKREELEDLQQQRERLLVAAEGSDAAEAALLDAEISGKIVELSAQTANGQLFAAEKTANELMLPVLRRSASAGDSARVQARIDDLDARIAELSAQISPEATTVVVDRAGYFSAQVDGYERILTPEALETLTLAELRRLSEENRAPTVPEHAVGRLVEGQKWYFVTEIPAERAAECEVGDRLQVDLEAQELHGLPMRVERIGDEGDAACVLVLSCEESLHNVIDLRRQTADIVFETYEGLRVPKQAIYFIDGETGVYVLENSRAAWKELELLLESGEDYIVRWDSGDTDNLWPKDELILTAEEIEDGMVIS